MKDILKMVYGDQKEVKLESQKIELGSTKELNEYINELKSNYKVIESVGNDLAKRLGEAHRVKYIFKKEIDNSGLNSSKAKKSIEEFIKKGKELGVDVSNIKEVKILNGLINDYKEYLKFYTSIGDIPDI
jgi:hypothetical protein